jgi:NAD(P)-dependent dehydrogenase (short-subunit alcohol dehydrogenase family)
MTTENLLKDKVAIITGASRGIGRATALRFAKAGAAVVLAARNEKAVQALAEEIRQSGGRALAMGTDVTNQNDVDLMATMALRAFRHIDIMVNNAGVLNPIGKTWEVHPNEWQNLIRINIIGPYLCARAVLPQMLDRGDGRIINVTSGAANSNIPGWGAYCTSKAALDRFTGVLAAEVAHTNIVVTALNPGTTDTQMQADIRSTPTANFERGDRFRALPRVCKLFHPDEPAQLLLWLASNFGKDQNGAILDISDQGLREQAAADLGLPVIPNRREM